MKGLKLRLSLHSFSFPRRSFFLWYLFQRALGLVESEMLFKSGLKPPTRVTLEKQLKRVLAR